VFDLPVECIVFCIIWRLPLSKVCHPFPKISCDARCRLGSLMRRNRCDVPSGSIYPVKHVPILGSLLLQRLVSVMRFQPSQTMSVTLAWNASTDPQMSWVTTFHYGGSMWRTHTICAGNATNATLSGLVGEPPTILRRHRMLRLARTVRSQTRVVPPGSHECSDCDQPPTLKCDTNLPSRKRRG